MHEAATSHVISDSGWVLLLAIASLFILLVVNILVGYHFRRQTHFWATVAANNANRAEDAKRRVTAIQQEIAELKSRSTTNYRGARYPDDNQ